MPHADKEETSNETPNPSTTSGQKIDKDATDADEKADSGDEPPAENSLNIVEVRRVSTKTAFLECAMCNYVGKMSSYGLSERDLEAASAVHGASSNTATGRNYLAMMQILIRTIPTAELFQLEVGDAAAVFRPIEVPFETLRQLHGAEEVERVRRIVARRGEGASEPESSAPSDETRAHQEEAVFYAEEVAIKEILQPFAKTYYDAMYAIRNEVYAAEASLRQKLRSSFQATKDAWLHKAYILKQALRCIGPLEAERRDILTDEEALRWKGLVLWFQNKRAQIMKDADIVENAMMESQMLLKRLRFKQLMEQSRAAVVEAERERSMGKWEPLDTSAAQQQRQLSSYSSPPTERKRHHAASRHVDPALGDISHSSSTIPLSHRNHDRQAQTITQHSHSFSNKSPTSSARARVVPTGGYDPSTPEPLGAASMHHGTKTAASLNYSSPAFNSSIRSSSDGNPADLSASRKAPTATINVGYKPAAAKKGNDVFKKSARKILPKGGFSHV